jgi:hypothetical protein
VVEEVVEEVGIPRSKVSSEYLRWELSGRYRMSDRRGVATMRGMPGAGSTNQRCNITRQGKARHDRVSNGHARGAR